MLLPLLPLLILPSLFPPAHAGGINWDVYEYGVVPRFHWSRPFPDDGTDPGGFDVHCRASRTFHARLYKLRDLAEPWPTGLAPWQEAIDDWLGLSSGRREYMGSWDGVDHKGTDREIVVMEWTDVPEGVRGWIAEQQRGDEANEKRWWFGVLEKPRREGEKVTGTLGVAGPAASVSVSVSEQGGGGGEGGGQEKKVEGGERREVRDEDKIVVFAAAAAYEILPLWVAKGSGCERDFNNLAKYKPQAIDHAVVAWVVDHTKPNRDLGKRDMTFTVEALSVTESEEGKRARLMWEKLHRTIKRNERRMLREERLKARKEMEEGRVRDEL
ncbi:hypothetical protein C8A03DRAFT_45644 [Achaetomium macrosporum]|uniref:Uncharacterized protein n=1 Tax=Achaetomium macrosporum TaxID=79813 RepID=A0AAN7C8I8_9PEZI|nr:hypothetical protein C8A03DRAFT_45644 [Achaetomium macrosporum]